MKRILNTAVVAALLLAAPPALAAPTAEQAAATEENKRLGSLYLRCDGQPNNVTGGETFARLLGAVTLLALFAPTPESPDPSKRLFGEKGIDACTRLLEDPGKGEGNGLRRVPLMLARAAHRIEAKDYSGAIEDVEKARGEARAINLIGNPYFDRSMGLSFDNLEAEARLRLGDAAGAQEASLRRLDTMSHSFVPLIFADTYAEHLHGFTPRAEQLLASLSRISPSSLNTYADRLEEAGRFGDAAARREALVSATEALKPEHPLSIFYARAALSHALAGEWDKARERAQFARSNLEQRSASGVAEDDAARVVEVLDLYDIVALAHDGKPDDARRNFAARSQWLTPGFGAVSEVNKRLREGARPEQLFGALSPTPAQMWEDRRAARLATELQKDTNNKDLFGQILPYAKIGEFEGLSKDSWRTDKPRMISKEPDAKTGLWSISSYASPQTRYDSILLHAAVQAQAHGKQGFTMILTTQSLSTAFVRFVDRTDNGVDPNLFIEAAPVIAELGKVIPSPADLEARKRLPR